MKPWHLLAQALCVLLCSCALAHVVTHCEHWIKTALLYLLGNGKEKRRLKRKKKPSEKGNGRKTLR